MAPRIIPTSIGITAALVRPTAPAQTPVAIAVKTLSVDRQKLKHNSNKARRNPISVSDMMRKA